MTRHISRARLVRAVLTGALLVPLLLWISGCWLLFNVPPVAGFSINEQAGQAPFAVTFSAGVLSKDEDGDIEQYDWDFGDGSTGSGKTVTHTYATAGTFTAVLVVTDNDGDTASNSKHIYVSPAPPPGPAASFSASPTSGSSPLTVFVDASASSYDDGVISQYRWDWGDGSTGYGKTSSHTYFSTGAQSYTLTLTLYATDGKTGTATKTISVTVPGGTTPAAGAPSARFSIHFDDITQSPSTVIYANHDVAPLQVWFDPEDSEAVEGRTIASYTWTFGDSSSTHTINSAPVKHVYRTDQSSEVFSVTLAVIDDAGAVGSITKSVKVYNYQPTAGFQIYDALGANALIVDETDVNEQGDWVAGDTWKSVDVTYNSVQTPSTTVWIRSLPPTLPTWVGDPTPVEDVDTQGTSSAEPSNFDTADSEDANLCFDPEGQGWDAVAAYDKTIKPDGWTNASWGIERIEISWGDTTTQNYDYYEWVMNGTGMFMHTYAFDGTTKTYTITVTAHDFLGAQASFSRKVTLKAGS